jgi:POT family proton-dependent oligopeptide transporter
VGWVVNFPSGFRYLPEDRPRATSETKTPLDGHQLRIVAALAAVAVLTIFQSISYYQNTNLGLIWIDGHVDLDLLGFHVPVAWFNSVDAFASIVAVPFLFALWRWQAARGSEPGDLGKIAVGAWLAAGANLVLVTASMISDRTNVLVPFLYNVMHGVAFLYYWPTLLALVSRTAPASIKATLMGAVFLTLFVGNLTIGWLGGFYERMTPTAFWAVHAGFAAVGGLLVLVFKEPLKRALAIA